MPSQALLVIDMQEKFCKKRIRNRDAWESTIQNMRYLINKANCNSIIVCIVKDGRGRSVSDLIPELYRLSGEDDLCFKKFADNAFKKGKTTPDIHRFLTQNEIEELIIVGTRSGICVKRTLIGALKSKKYNCTVVSDAHIPRFPWKGTIERSNKCFKKVGEKQKKEVEVIPAEDVVFHR